MSTTIGPVVVLLDTCELISGAQEYLRLVMRRSGSRGCCGKALSLTSPASTPPGRYRPADPLLAFLESL